MHWICCLLFVAFCRMILSRAGVIHHHKRMKLPVAFGAFCLKKVDASTLPVVY